MKKQISGKIFTGAADSQHGVNSLAMSIDNCEGEGELRSLYKEYGRELIENVVMTGDAAIGFFSWDGELYEFEGTLDCEDGDLTITSFTEL